MGGEGHPSHASIGTEAADSWGKNLIHVSIFTVLGSPVEPTRNKVIHSYYNSRGITSVNVLSNCNRLQPIQVAHQVPGIARLSPALEDMWTALTSFRSKVLLPGDLQQGAIPHHLPGQIPAQASALFKYIYIWFKIHRCKFSNKAISTWGTTMLAPQHACWS